MLRNHLFVMLSVVLLWLTPLHLVSATEEVAELGISEEIVAPEPVVTLTPVTEPTTPVPTDPPATDNTDTPFPPPPSDPRFYFPEPPTTVNEEPEPETVSEEITDVTEVPEESTIVDTPTDTTDNSTPSANIETGVNDDTDTTETPTVAEPPPLKEIPDIVMPTNPVIDIPDLFEPDESDTANVNDPNLCFCSPVEPNNQKTKRHAVIAKLQLFTQERHTKQFGFMFNARGLHTHQRVVSAHLLWKGLSKRGKVARQLQRLQWFVDKSQWPKWFNQYYQPSDCNNLTKATNNQYWTSDYGSGFNVTNQFREWYQAASVNNTIVMVGRYAQQTTMQYTLADMFGHSVDKDAVELLLEVEEPEVQQVDTTWVQQLNRIPDLQNAPLQKRGQYLVMQRDGVEFMMEPYQRRYSHNYQAGLDVYQDYMRFIAPDGLEVLTRPVVHDLQGLRATLATLGQVNIRHYEQWLDITLNQHRYWALPDFSSTPTRYQRPGLYPETNDRVCFVYLDQNGRMRQQDFHVAPY